MNTNARRQTIIQLLQQTPSISISELVDKLSVSSVTIRKDILFLEKSGMVTHTRGEVHIASSSTVLPFISRTDLNSEDKIAIARSAVKMIDEGDSIMLDSGTTTLAIARQLLNIQKLTVVTNSIPISSTLGNSNINVMVTGGILYGRQLSLVGPEAEEYLSRIEVNKLFLGCSGVRGSIGLTTSSSFESSMKRKMISVAKKVIAVIDPSKFKTSSINLFADFTEINCIITTAPIADTELLKRLKELGTEIICTLN